MMGKTVAQLVDDSIQNVLTHSVGWEIPEKLIELGIDWGNTLSVDEYKEFVKRNLKQFTKQIRTELEDRL